jgi:hypothetical protein
MMKLDPRTRALLNGDVGEGGRNAALFAGVCNLLGCGCDPRHVEAIALQGAIASGLPEREARAAIKSAIRRKAVQP